MIIGIGSENRGDDLAGWEVVDRLETVRGCKHDGEPATLLELISSADHVVLVDAMRSGHPVGTVQHFDAAAGPLPSAVCRSTHGVGVAEVVELARLFGTLPRNCTVIGIEGSNFAIGSTMSGEVAAAIDSVVESLRDA